MVATNILPMRHNINCIRIIKVDDTKTAMGIDIIRPIKSYI